MGCPLPSSTPAPPLDLLPCVFRDGDEFFTTLGNEEIEQPVPGEVIFVDQAGLVSARRWCWRQSEQSAANENTTSAIITVEGHHENAEEDVQSAVDDLIDLLEEFAGTPSFPNSGYFHPKYPPLTMIKYLGRQ